MKAYGLRVTAIKIDRSFIESLTIAPNDKAIVAGVISLAHALGLTVVAEGVETLEQLQALQDLDCDQAQGFLFSKPLSASDLPAEIGSWISHQLRC